MTTRRPITEEDLHAYVDEVLDAVHREEVEAYVLLIRPMEKDMNTPRMSQSNQGAVTGFTWARNGTGYSVAGDSSADILHPIANEIRRQLEPDI